MITCSVCLRGPGPCPIHQVAAAPPAPPDPPLHVRECRAKVLERWNLLLDAARVFADREDRVGAEALTTAAEFYVAALLEGHATERMPPLTAELGPGEGEPE